MFLRVEELSIELGEFSLKKVSLDVDEGDYMVLIGPTGSGKSILLETIAGFYLPESGRIELMGRDITRLPPEHRNVSVVYQDYMLFPHMSVMDNIAYGLKKKRREEEIEDAVKRVSEVLKISHLLHRSPTTLSGGEQQRVAIARALVVEPALLLMDEPFSALDVKTREKLRVMVREAVGEYGTTVLHVTHDFEDVFTLANRVVVMRNGEVIQHGTPGEVFSNPATDFVADFVGVNILGCRGVSTSSDGSVVECGDVKIHTSDYVGSGREVRISIPPESIIVSPSVVSTSARNVIQGTVEGMERRGHIVWLRVAVKDIRLRVIITPNSVEALGLEPDMQVYLIFKASSTRVIG